MKKVILVSDNHGNAHVLRKIVDKHYDADLYLHCGDSEMFKKDLKPFYSVRGNNDFRFDFDKSNILVIENLKILIMHGYGYVAPYTTKYLVEYASKIDIDAVFYGHTHIKDDFTVDNIRYLNPGSCNHSRDGSLPSYYELLIDKKEIEVIVHEIEGDKIC